MSIKVVGRRSLLQLYPQRQSSVLVIIPAYNEQGNIPTVVEGIKRWVGFADILVINDGSTDATAEVARLSGVSAPGRFFPLRRNMR